MSKNCPFCGKDRIKIERVNSNKIKRIGLEIYNQMTLSVRCNCCHSRGPTVSMYYKSNDIIGKELELRKATEQAMNLWCNRI